MILTANPSKVSIYDNRKTRYKATQVKAITGADIVFNGSLFNWSDYSPCCDIRVGGKTLNDDQWGYYGYGWNDNELPKVMHSKDMFAVDNYLSCIWAIHNGEKQTLNDNQSGIGGVRGRTAFGFKGDGTMVIIVTSDSNGAMTLSQTRDTLYDGGCVSGIILDGGGSSQIDTDGTDIRSLRIVSNFVCVWLEPEKKEVKPVAKSVYLSPSTQENNIGAAPGYVEETEMNLIADLIEPELKRHGIVVYRNKPTMTLSQVIADSNAKAPTLHLAVHSNAHNAATINKTARGCVVCIYRAGSIAATWASRVLAEMDKIQPFRNVGSAMRVAVMPGLAEVKNTNGPATIVEVDFHDNAGAVWIQANRQAIADALCKATVEQLGITYIPRTVHADPGPTGDAWYEKAQEWVLAENISDATRPNDPVTRAEVWQMFYNYSH